jgi:hypothetical protein
MGKSWVPKLLNRFLRNFILGAHIDTCQVNLLLVHTGQLQLLLYMNPKLSFIKFLKNGPLHAKIGTWYKIQISLTLFEKSIIWWIFNVIKGNIIYKYIVWLALQ